MKSLKLWIVIIPVIIASTFLVPAFAQRDASRRTPPSSGQASGEQEANSFWGNYVASCGNSHYMRKAPGVFVELRGFQVQMRYDALTQADRLNGIQARGVSWIDASAHRFYSNGAWRQWGDGTFPDFTLVNSVRFQKAQGRWSFNGVGYFNDYAKPVSCADVPGYRSAKMNEAPTNSVQIDDYHNFPIRSFIFWDVNTNLVGDKFSQSTTTFVNWKITYTGTAFNYSLPPVESRWYKDGSEWSYADSANFDNISEGHLWHGKGWEEPGHWEPGAYTVKVYLRKQLIAQKSFEIVPDESLPGALRYDGIYYKKFDNGAYWFLRLLSDGTARDLSAPVSNNFEELLKDAWRCTGNDLIRGMYSESTFGYYCKGYNVGEGSFNLRGSQIEFTTQPKFNRADGSITFNGTVTSSALKLSWDSRATNSTGKDTFTFTRCPYRDCH